MRAPDGAATGWWRPRLPAPASDLLQVHEEGFELWRIGIGVAHKRRQCVGQPIRALARVGISRNADEAPVDWNADLEDLLAIDHGRAEPLCHQRQALDLAALGAQTTR